MISGRLEKVYYEKAVKNPDPLAYNNYAYSLAIHGTKEDLDKAEDLARKAVQLFARNYTSILMPGCFT